MSAEDVKQRILAWCHESDDIDVRDTGAPGDADFGLTLTVRGAASREVQVVKEAGRQAVLLRLDGGAGETSSLQEFLHTRPGSIDAAEAGDGVGLSTRVWIDGLTRHTFLTAVYELTRSGDAWTAWGSRGATGAAAGAAAGAATPAETGAAAEPAASSGFTSWASPQPAEQQQEEPAGETEQPAFRAFELGGQRDAASATPPGTGWSGSDPAASQPSTPSWSTREQGQGAGAGSSWSPQPAADAATTSWSPAGGQSGGSSWSPAESTAPAPAQAAWQPTHTVPPTGMPAWAAPDPAQAPVARLDPHLQVQVTETAGLWAHIVCSNGWAAWVDSRQLQQS